MFIGHFGLAFAAKRAAPRVPLTLLVAAAQLADVVWPFLLIAGVERVRIAPGDTAFTPLAFDYYPWTHGLVPEIVAGAVFGVLWLTRTRDRRGAVVLGALVVSHWVLDVISHRPDMQIAPGIDARFGLGLWNSIWGTVVVESALFVAGVLVYIKSTAARTRAGSISLWTFVGLLVLADASNFSGPPPNITALIYGSIAGIVAIFALTLWVDRYRVGVER